MRPLVILLGLFAAAPAWTPQSSDLLFTSGRDGNGEIFVLKAGHKDWKNLSNNKAADNWPVWSPDAKKIAFQSMRAGNLDICTMNADGTDQRQLTDNPEPDYLPSWSPDGTSILFTSWRVEKYDKKRMPHIYVMNADGSGQRRLIANTVGVSEGASWAPDGRKIVFSRKPGDKGADIVVASKDGTRETQLTHDEANDVHNGSPTFSPDGKWIAFYSDDTKTSSLVVIDVEGKQRRTVVAEGQNWYPRWSPDGKWLVYTAAVASGGASNTDVFAVPVEGGKPVLLIGEAKRDLEASWAPK